MSRGLKYLHQAQPQVIHRDLKLENILLKGKTPNVSHAKIAGGWVAVPLVCKVGEGG